MQTHHATRPAREGETALSRGTRRFGATIAVLSLVLPASALARPSLIGLEGDLGLVVDGLCHGDPALCGSSAPLSVAGQLDFDGGTYIADFAELRFAFDRSSGGGFNYVDIEVTLDASDLGAQLSAELVSGTLFPTVDVIVPNPSGPGDVTILSLSNAVIRTLEVASEGAWTPITLEFSKATYSWLGSTSVWDTGIGSGSGCTVAPGEKHVALAGNDPSLLNPGEVEVDFGLSAANLGGGATVGFSYSRGPTATSACYLRHTAQATALEATFSRLSALSDTFATQLVAEQIDVKSASTVSTYALSISGATYREAIELQTLNLDLTTRTFNPGTGAETSSTTQSLP